MGKVAVTSGPIFDGAELRTGKAALFQDGLYVGLVPETEITSGMRSVDLVGEILSPGFVDLQVNGGGGVMLGDTPSLTTLEQIATAHRKLGVRHMLPTLITDTREITTDTIDAVRNAVSSGVPGIAGLHLEGPHLSQEKKGAHNGSLIRAMTTKDLEDLIAAKTEMPVLMVTVAPEAVSADQVAAMSDAGIIVSLGHTDADFETCLAYFDAGARCVTHLFNAMSQMRSREPGLVGAALHSNDVSVGLIADGIHVHPATLGAAWRGKSDPGSFYLVSDAMAVAGTSNESFQLNGRDISRRDGRLTLEDGTLAGADLTLAHAVRTLFRQVDIPLEAALHAAITTPAKLIDVQSGLVPGKTTTTDLICLSSDLSETRPLTERLR